MKIISIIHLLSILLFINHVGGYILPGMTPTDYAKGEEVFNHYGEHSTIEWLYNWNMLSTDVSLDKCVDMVFQKHLMHVDKKRRSSCLANLTLADLNFLDVVEEMKEALNTIGLYENLNEADLSTILGLSTFFTKVLG